MAVNKAANNFLFDSRDLKNEPVCRYLGKLDDSELFRRHIEEAKSKLSKQCILLQSYDILCLRKLLIHYYESNIKSIAQYRVLVHA